MFNTLLLVLPSDDDETVTAVFSRAPVFCALSGCYSGFLCASIPTLLPAHFAPWNRVTVFVFNAYRSFSSFFAFPFVPTPRPLAGQLSGTFNGLFTGPLACEFLDCFMLFFNRNQNTNFY